MKIYTRTGDQGETSLFGGGRAAKSHIRVAAYGDVDELSAVIGMVRATPPKEHAGELLESIQRDLFAIGAILASPEPDRVATALGKADLSEARVTELERAIDEADASLSQLTSFVVPGGAPKACIYHFARTVCRRAERSTVALAQRESVPQVITGYLNRLSDLLFVLARQSNANAGKIDTTW